MAVDERGLDPSLLRRAWRAVSVGGLAGAVLGFWYDAPSAAVGGLVAVAVGAGIVSSRMNRKARSARLERFEKWAHARGLVMDPSPLPGLDRVIDPDRPVLLQEMSLSLICAATTRADVGRLTVMEWEYSTGSSSGRLLRMAGLVLWIPSTGVHLLLRPLGRLRLPHIPGTPDLWQSGHLELDSHYELTLEAGREPTWVDDLLAGELVRAGGDDASIEVKNEMVLVARTRGTQEDWDSLLGDGQRLAAAFGRVLG